MNKLLIVAGLVALGLNAATGIAADSGEDQKKEAKKGTTIGDIGRGLKSAEQNIEKEIPKIGPAIGETFKKLTGKDKQSDDKPAKQSK